MNSSYKHMKVMKVCAVAPLAAAICAYLWNRAPLTESAT
jgi:hypothetical protein